MTESIRGLAKRQRSVVPARSVVDYEPASDVAPLARPIAGLALPGPLALHRSAGARPTSVVGALRRQAIRRSGKAAVMELGSDHDDSEMEEEEEEEEAPSWEGTAAEAGKNLVGWLRAKAGDGTNYTVAVCSDDIYITKVNGVTGTTKLIQELATHIESEGIQDGRDIYLCQKYNSSQPSNHAEMCVLAAIGEANLASITFFECTSPSCDYCAETLAHYKVLNTSPEGAPASQMGWTHPFQPIVFGTQLGGHSAQVAELKNYLKDPQTRLTIGRATSTAPKGRSTKWL